MPNDNEHLCAQLVVAREVLAGYDVLVEDLRKQLATCREVLAAQDKLIDHLRDSLANAGML